MADVRKDADTIIEKMLIFCEKSKKASDTACKNKVAGVRGMVAKFDAIAPLLCENMDRDTKINVMKTIEDIADISFAGVYSEEGAGSAETLDKLREKVTVLQTLLA